MIKQKTKVSIGLCHFLISYFALIAFTLKLTAMKKDPKSPQATPKTIAPGITSVGVTSEILILPNFNVEDDHVLRFPCKIASRTAKPNTAEEQAKNVFHRS